MTYCRPQHTLDARSAVHELHRSVSVRRDARSGVRVFVVVFVGDAICRRRLFARL